MRWEIKQPKKEHNKAKGMIPKQPKIGDIKKETKFAFLPIKITPTSVIWMERYVKIYEYGEKTESKKYLSIADYGRVPIFEITAFFGDSKNTYNTWLLKKLDYYNEY